MKVIKILKMSYFKHGQTLREIDCISLLNKMENPFLK